MSNNSLYALSNEYADLYNALLASVDDDGAVDENAFAMVERAEGAFTEKAVAVATVYRALGNDIEQYENEIKRLTDIKKRIENEQERVKNYLAAACETTGIESIKGVYANISFRASEQTIIDDESALPKEFTVVKTTTTPDKTKIKAAIKSGQAVPGAHVESKRNIQIK